MTGRSLGATEQLFHEMKKHGGMTVVAFLHFAIRDVADARSLDMQTVHAAVCDLQNEFPLLRAGIRSAAGAHEFYLPGATDVPVRRIVLEHPSHFDLHAATCLNTCFSSEAPLWRLDVIDYAGSEKRASLLLTIDHSIADATAACHFLDLVLKRYGEIRSGHRRPACAVSEFHPSLEARVSHRLKPREIARFLLQEATKLVFPGVQPAFDGAAPVAMRATATLHQRLSEQETRALVDIARQQETTVNAVINAAMLFVFYKCVARESVARGEYSITPRLRVSMVNNVGFRKLLGIDASLPGVYISAVYHRMRLSPDLEFWRLARTVRDGIEHEMARNTPIISARLFQWLQGVLPEASRQALLDGPRQGRLESLCISNIGRLDLSGEQGDFDITDMGFCSAQHGFGHGFSLALLTFREQLSLNLQYVQPLISTARARYFLGELTALLQRTPHLASLRLQDFAHASSEHDMQKNTGVRTGF